MSLPTNLFIDTPEVQDVSMTRLSNDVESWPEEITQKLYESIPEANGMNCFVKFMKVDEENGTGTGSVVISTPNKQAMVPAIVKEFNLYPLDVIIADKKHLPLTPEFFKAIFSSNQIFTNLEEFPHGTNSDAFNNYGDTNLYNTIYPPNLGGRYAYASAGGSIFELLAGTIDGSLLKNNLLKNEKTAAMFIRNGHADFINKVANLKPVNEGNYEQSEANLVNNIRMLKLDSPNKYSLISTSDKVFHPHIESVDISGIRTKLQDDLHDLDMTGEKILPIPQSTSDVFLTCEKQDVPVLANTFGPYMVRGKTGLFYKGLVIPTVIDFDKNPVNLKLFLSPGYSTIQGEIAGVPLDKQSIKLDVQQPKIGQTGTFIFAPEKGAVLATVPITITAMGRVEGKIFIKATGLMGEPIQLYISSEMDIQDIIPFKKGWLLPGRMKWSPMEVFENVSNSPEMYSLKHASVELKRNAVLSYLQDGKFMLKGLDKYANEMRWDPTNLSITKTAFILSALGLRGSKLAHAVKHAKITGPVGISGLNLIPVGSEKKASLKTKKDMREKLAQKIRCDMIKEASYVESAQTVDALLSLNFVNADNIQKFVGKIPHFKATLSHLVQCLIASRLGVKEIPEQQTSSAIHKLIDVIRGLETLRATQALGAQQ